MFLRTNKTLASVALFLTVFACGTAWADDCDNLNSNQEWTTGMAQIRSDYDLKNYDEVISRGEELSYLCARSPEVNYLVGKAYAAKGQNEDALVYLDIAGNAAAELQASPELIRDIFYVRYEVEHPNTSESVVNALKLENARIAHENDMYLEKIDAMRKALAESNAKTSNSADSRVSLDDGASLQELKESYHKTMWAGIGIGIGGAVITGVGGALVATSDKYSHTGFHDEELDTAAAHEYGKNAGVVRIQDYKIGAGFVAGWTLVGAGIAATVTGVVLASVYGYKKEHIDDELSFNISPTGFEFGLKF